MNAETVGEETMAEGLPISDAIEGLGERPEHRAICDQCKLAVTYRPTSSGAGFTVVGHTSSDPELTFGIGANGTPLCPGGHGEMTIADDTLVSAAEAFALAAGQLEDPVQRSLPGIVPEFNFRGAYTEIEAKAVEVEALTKVEEEDHDTYKESKKAREKAADVLTKMILEFRRRRREKAEGPGEQASASPGVCRFERLHPGIFCPMPHEGLTAEHLTSEAHGCEAQDLLVKQEIEACVAQLAALNILVTAETLGALPIDQLSEVQAWALDATQNPENLSDLLKGLPKALGRPHIADAGEPQSCVTCGGTLTFPGPVYAGTMIGTDCPGPPVDHHYPAKKKGKAARKGKAGK